MKIAVHKTLKYDYNFFVDHVPTAATRQRCLRRASIDESPTAPTISRA
jgi:hypothetical protein